MKRIFILTLISVCLLGCSTSKKISESKNLQIRISNVSTFDYENINVNASGEIVHFGNLKANSSSDYKIFDLAYKYAFIEFQIDEETFKFQPIDYVGETPLKKGKYSYQVNVKPDRESGKVTVSLKKD